MDTNLSLWIMQVLSLFCNNWPTIISKLDKTASLFFLSLSTILNNHTNVNYIAVLIYKAHYKTACTTNYNLILKGKYIWYKNYLYSSAFRQSCNDFMEDNNKMTTTNNKRYLQNKLGDSKRQSPDSVSLESTEMDGNTIVDTLTCSRHTSRQSVQRELSPGTISLEKSIGTEKSIFSTSGSKKHVRSCKHDIEQLCDYKEGRNRCSPKNYLENSLNELYLKTADINSKATSESSRTNVDKLKNEESLIITDNPGFKNKVETKEYNSGNEKSEHGSYDEGNVIKINNLNETNVNKNNKNSSIIASEKSTQSVANKYTALGYKSINFRNTTYSPITSSVINKTDCVDAKRYFKLEKQLLLDDNNIKGVTRKEIFNKNENNPATLCENYSSISPRPPLDRFHYSNETQENDENNSSHISNSLCSDNSKFSTSCCTESINSSDNKSHNESKMELEPTNKTKSTNLTISPSQFNSISSQEESYIVGAQKDEQQYQNFDNDDYSGCSVKSQSVYNTSKICNVSNSCPKTTESSKLENIYFEQKTNKDGPETENIEYKKDVYSTHEKKNVGIFINTEDSQNTNKHDCYTNTSLEISVHEGSNNDTRKSNDEYEMSQLDDKTSNPMQLEEGVINAANKVYTQTEEQFHHPQQNLASISSDYGHIINNNQQSNQQDRDTQRRDNDLNLFQQQDSSQQNSISQQPPYLNAPLYQQQEHYRQLHIQHHHIRKEIELQQHNHNISQDTQRELGQLDHSTLMEFLHPQHHHSSTKMQSPLHQQQHHQHQIHEVYHNLMIDEFHDDHHSPYKLGLSPSTVKHENQDDGYETSAGDVLTPNSNTSSTHSVTPQHHLHHGTSGSGFTANIPKNEEQHNQQQKHNIHLQQHKCTLINGQILRQELTLNESARNLTTRDTYFIDDDLNSSNKNNSLHNILTPPHSHSQSHVSNQEARTMNDYLGMQSDIHSNILNSARDMYGLTSSTVNHEPSQTQTSGEMSAISNTNQQHNFFSADPADMSSHDKDSILNLQTKSIQKKRGRKKKITEAEIFSTLERVHLNDLNAAARYIKAKERKKHDRFNGMSEEEIVKRILPDHLCENLDIVIIGINPGLFAAYKGHHYAGPGNHFWKCLYLSGLTQEQMSADEDFKLIKHGIGFTNMVQRATKGSADLTRKEIKEGSRILLEKLQRYRPKIAVFNGKLIFEVFSGKKEFNFGRQPECVEGTDTFIWVMPSSSARCAQLPRAADKVPFYAALKKFRDYLNGLIPHIEQSECVFTEERIRQQCEHQNYKDRHNNIEAANITYSNAVGICNSDKLLPPNTFDSETNPLSAAGEPGPPQNSTSDNTATSSFMMSSLVGTPLEKKKRGRPKKIKEQEDTDFVTRNTLQSNNQILTPDNGEYNNILNLSVEQVSNSAMPKKKRGRPKKVKLLPDTLQTDIVQSSVLLDQKPNILSVDSMKRDVVKSSPHHIQGVLHTSLYSTPPPHHQRNIYSPIVSPGASPSLNCSYSTNTPPSQPNHDKFVLTMNETTSSKTTNEVRAITSQHLMSEQNFCESSPPNSPNICAVDFNPLKVSSATASSVINDNVNSELNTMHRQRFQSSQKPRFNSPNNGEATPDHNTNAEHFQQWLSSRHNNGVHSPATTTDVSNTMFSNSSQQISKNYHDQQQVQTIKQQEVHPQWSLRHQSRYDDSHYLLSSSVNQTQPHRNESHHQQNQCGNDVARKSLSGLESLVDQIPTMSESESIVLSSATAVNAQAAAAAAVENRLQIMQNSAHNDSQLGDNSHFSSIPGSSNINSSDLSNNQMQQSNTSTSLLSTNFSVSNLAASSTTNNNIGNIDSNNQENYAFSSNSRPLTNTNAYHHSNIMAAGVLAAAANNSPSNISTPSTPSTTSAHHVQMYMDPHAHFTTHVPINPIYPGTAASHHHHSAVADHHHHHSAAIHYNSAPHAATEYTANNLYSSSQSNVGAGHTLHMPSPNYPYGYSTASSQSNYTPYPHTYTNYHHGHAHAHHTAHHLGMFDRLKPSDITGYSSGF